MLLKCTLQWLVVSFIFFVVLFHSINYSARITLYAVLLILCLLLSLFFLLFFERGRRVPRDDEHFYMNDENRRIVLSEAVRTAFKSKNSDTTAGMVDLLATAALPEKKYIVCEIGVDAGQFSLFAKFIPRSRFLAFEPNSRKKTNLLENIALNGIKNIEVCDLHSIEELKPGLDKALKGKRLGVDFLKVSLAQANLTPEIMDLCKHSPILMLDEVGNKKKEVAHFLDRCDYIVLKNFPDGVAAIARTKLFEKIPQEKIFSVEERTDGFGAQFQTLLCGIVVIENAGFVYNHIPVKSMEHNYSNDAGFLKKAELCMNIKKNYLHQKIAEKNTIKLGKIIENFQENIDNYMQSNSMKNLKYFFRENKKNPNDGFFTIAVHIRTCNNSNDIAHAVCQSRHDADHTKTYADIFDKFRTLYPRKNLKFIVISQGEVDDFSGYVADDVELHLNGDQYESFTEMVFSDVLVMAKSSFSYCAGLLSDADVYYFSFWHKVPSHWKQIT